MKHHTCPACRCRFTDDEELDAQLVVRVAVWETECAARGWPMRGGRVSEHVAAKLLGMSKRALANRRLRGDGPRATHLPVNGSQWSYELAELAAWYVARQEGQSWKVC